MECGCSNLSPSHPGAWRGAPALGYALSRGTFPTAYHGKAFCPRQRGHKLYDNTYVTLKGKHLQACFHTRWQVQ